MSWEDFCGNKSIWDSNLLLNNSYPQFTECFMNTLLVWVPCGILWLVLPVYLGYLICKDGDIPLPLSCLNISKTFLSLVLFFLAVVDLIKSVSDKQDGENKQALTPAYFSAVSIKAASYLLTAILIQLERRAGYITSGVLFIFYLLSFVASIIPFYTDIEKEVYDKDIFKFSITIMYFALLFVQFILNCIAESRSRRGYYEMGKEPCPEIKASFLSRLTFWWINGLVIRGYKKDLEEEDIWALNPRDNSDTVVPEFEEAWSKEVRKHKQIAEMEALYSKKTSVRRTHVQDTEKTPLLRQSPITGDQIAFKGGKSGGKDQKSKASLFRVLNKVYGPVILKAWGCKFFYDLLQFVSPTLLNVLIGYVENKINEPEKYKWKGYVYASAFFVVALLQSTFMHQNFHIGMTLGMRIRSALISAVYNKALTMNSEARKTSTVGEIVNLMSVDCQRMQDVTGYFWMLWSAPLQIGLATWLLWNQLGASVLAGVGVMILLIPLNAFISIRQRKLQVALMRLKDSRMKLMSEVLNGIKVLKLYAWEPSFQKKITAIRNKELNILKKYAYLGAFSSFSFTCAPFLVTLATFATYVLVSSSHYLDAQKAFVSLSLFNILRFPINLLPMIISYVIQAQVSITRISKFLKNGDLDVNNVQHDDDTDSSLVIQNGVFSWDDNLQPALRDINLDIPRGKLVAVVGQVGSGKSSLISAFLGEMDKLQGKVNVKGSIAYVPQQAWIQNATVRDNILFGKTMDQCKYDKVVEACALGPDLEILSGGDMTEIGEKGINLSGGQKQRVSLARAVYNNADIYLMDDPLSAVDSHVGKHIFQKVVGEKGLLRNKTRILVTHGVHWLPMVDTIVVLVDGKITELGSYDELLSHDGAFAQFLKTYLTQEDQGDDDDDPEIQQIRSKILERVESVTSDTAASGDDVESKLRQRRTSQDQRPKVSRSISVVEKSGGECKPDKDGGKEGKKKDRAEEKLIEAEKRESGKVKKTVYLKYIRAVGVIATILIFLLYVVNQGASVGANIWLSMWTDDKVLKNQNLSSTTEYTDRNNMYLGVYGGLGLAQAIVVLVNSLLSSLTQVKASGRLHEKMLINILRCPMAFFDTTPVGRIVNRFSRDVEVMDSILPGTFRMWINIVFSTLSTVVVISYSTPIFLSVIIPIGIFYYFVQKFYIPTSRQLQRLESTTRSPIYNHFSETLTGASTIRAYKQQERFIQESKDRVDKNISFYFCRIASNRWLGFRLEMVGNLVVFAAAMFAVLSTNISGGIVGLSVSYALQITGALNMLVRMTSDLETNVVSVERVKEYTEVPTEAEWSLPFRKPPHGWPDRGQVNFYDYKTRYRPGLDLVLHGISCEIKGGEKVGIVGRTGAGKSSLTVALFRLIESAGGGIVIDGQRISEMGLHDLRLQLTILPQDPVLFSGSLRMNLDPFDSYTDEQIWRAIEHAHLKKFVSDLPDGLQHECGEGGQNLSVGQRQLVCLARTLLRKTKILILDEATAAVDMETDDLIQETIRTEFKDCTVLTIAHRLNTIMDYDKVLVLDQGLVKEYDSPENLLKDNGSAFYSMAKDANLV